jgi:exodeoxyribonuclease V alpha subunit
MVGDSDQLPSVGAGNVLWDIIESGMIKTVKLFRIFRQAEKSPIVLNAHRINSGEMPYTRNDPGSDFYFLVERQPEIILETIKDLVLRRLPGHYKLDPLVNIRVMAPIYAGILGVDNLNFHLQKVLNPNGRVAFEGKDFRINDKVMQIKNNYNKGIFNGDIGIVESFDEEDEELIVNFDGQRVGYDYDDLRELVLAYAITVHKSQGSEYKAIVMPVTTHHYIMLQRNLIYTAITRAKQLVVLIGTKQALAIAVKNNKVDKRYTTLAQRLRF